MFLLNSLKYDKNFLASCTNTDNIMRSKELKRTPNHSLLLKATPNLAMQPQNRIINLIILPLNIMLKCMILHTNKYLSLYQKMYILLIKVLIIFNVFWVSSLNMIGVTETRFTKQVSLLSNLNLNNYSYEVTPTETTTGDIVLYIANPLSY